MENSNNPQEPNNKKKVIYVLRVVSWVLLALSIASLFRKDPLSAYLNVSFAAASAFMLFKIKRGKK